MFFPGFDSGRYTMVRRVWFSLRWLDFPEICTSASDHQAVGLNLAIYKINKTNDFLEHFLFC